MGVNYTGKIWKGDIVNFNVDVVKKLLNFG